MTTVQEAIEGENASPLAAGLRQGLRAIDQNQQVTFRQYNRLVLPLDGFVFWVAAPLMTLGALQRTAAFNASAFGAGPPFGTQDAPPLENGLCAADGSLHFATSVEQTEETNYALNRVTFTSEQEVNGLNRIGPNTMFIAQLDDGVSYAFSQRGSFYRQAGLWHYSGTAVVPTMRSQLVDDPSFFDSRQLVVGNSLPGWLAINQYAPLYPVLLPFPKVMLYPSFAVPANLPPPYGAVHIGEEDTDAVAAAPTLGSKLSHYQLAQDRVRVTLYGLNNAAALTFQDAVLGYASDANVFGITNVPVVRDVKQTQPELLTLAMKKRIDFGCSYLQQTQREVARQLITSCLITGEDLIVRNRL